MLAEAMPGYDPALPSGEHGSAPIVLHLEVPRGRVLTEPHKLALVVDDHRSVLACALLQGYEDLAGSGAVHPLCYLDGGRPRSGRERNAHTRFGSTGVPLARGQTFRVRKGVSFGLCRNLSFEVCSSRSQPTAFVKVR